MRIGIDGRELCGHPTGVGRYLGGLLREWAQSDQAARHEFLIYLPTSPAVDGLDARFQQRRLVPSGATIWEQVRLPAAIARDRLDLFFSPGYTAPLATRVPVVVAIHDLSFAAHPEWFSKREGTRRRLLSRWTARKAAAVITISQFSRGEVVSRFDVASDRVHVIPPGIDPPAGYITASLSPAKRVLYVGSIFNRRHVPDLISAFGAMARKHPDVELDLVGDNRSYPGQDIASMIAAQSQGRARWHRYVSDAELGSLYRSAGAFAFLSEYEGLGMTPLEALSVGVPSVLLDTAVARESCGDSALYVSPGDIPATTAALEQLLFDAPTRARLLAAGPAVLDRFKWPQAATATLRVLESVG